MLESITELAMVFAERLRRTDMHNAIGTLFEDDVELAEPDRPQWCGRGGRDLRCWV
jgi:hypothetical protein